MLRNLARTVENPYSLPFYASVTQAKFNIHKCAWARRGLLLIPYTFFEFVFDITLDRVIAGDLTTGPTNDPDRLELMQTAYQLAVRLEAVDPMAFSRLAQFLGFDPRTQIPCGWFGVGTTRLSVPADSYLHERSHHTFVWVPQNRVRELTQFTLLIQRIATAPDELIPSPLPKQAKN